MTEDTLEAKHCPKCLTDRYVMLVRVPQVGVLRACGFIVRCDQCGKETEPHLHDDQAVKEWNDQ